MTTKTNDRQTGEECLQLGKKKNLGCKVYNTIKNSRQACRKTDRQTRLEGSRTWT